MQAGLDESNTNVGYLCGRYFALICFLQYKAISKNSNELKYYKLACQYPQKAFSMLNPKLEGAYLNKVKAAHYWRAQRDEILNKFTTGIPAKLSLEEQAAFMLGFSHQNLKLFEKKEKEDTNNTQKTINSSSFKGHYDFNLVFDIQKCNPYVIPDESDPPRPYQNQKPDYVTDMAIKRRYRNHIDDIYEPIENKKANNLDEKEN